MAQVGCSGGLGGHERVRRTAVCVRDRPRARVAGAWRAWCSCTRCHLFLCLADEACSLCAADRAKRGICIARARDVHGLTF